MLVLQDISNPLLFNVSKEVKEIDTKILDIVSDIKDITVKQKAYGVAAPQVGIDGRFFVFRKGCDSKLFRTCINPVIISRAGVCYFDGGEGCLSIKDLTFPVRRSKVVELEYTDENGKRCKELFYDEDAICVQHEMDHLNGIMLFNYMSVKQIKEYRNKIDKRLAQYLEI